jgi:D-alanyl-lipoteichoic acid acyltransferase DltB (MBOAT superfamily)
MIFTSLAFIFVFLPLAIAGYAVASKLGHHYSTIWLVIASLTFYGFWAPYLILLISASIAFNYSVSLALRNPKISEAWRSHILMFGITADLLALFYYKYFYSIVVFLAPYLGHAVDWAGSEIILPLGISFFTFTQIGYLVDCKDGVTKSNAFSDYILFVTFFPHLIAGPILHNGDMMPQFADPSKRGLKAENFAPGLAIFTLGMLKKSFFADPFSAAVAEGFGHAATSTMVASWITAISYSLQLYFDFSGYSDMAVGLALLFNVRFPANFNSPYKARNIIDFWQRWHMSLTRYLTQYLYNPIAITARRGWIARGRPMSRKALETVPAFASLVAYPTVVTMGLAGIWHGAGLQFLVFGLLHGIYLSVNHGWRMFRPKSKAALPTGLRLAAVIAGEVALTYVAVLVAQVFFRAASCRQALQLLEGMVGLHGLTTADILNARSASHGLAARAMGALHHLGIDATLFPVLAKIGALFVLIWSTPNTQQILALANPVLRPIPRPAPAFMLWRHNLPWALLMGTLVFVAIMSLGGTSEFLYFQF